MKTKLGTVVLALSFMTPVALQAQRNSGGGNDGGDRGGSSYYGLEKDRQGGQGDVWGHDRGYDRGQKFKRRVALNASIDYLNALERYYRFAVDCRLNNIARKVKRLRKVVYNRVYRKLDRGFSRMEVARQMRGVERNVERVLDQIRRDRPGYQAARKFKRVDRQRLKLQRALDSRHGGGRR